MRPLRFGVLLRTVARTLRWFGSVGRWGIREWVGSGRREGGSKGTVVDLEFVHSYPHKCIGLEPIIRYIITSKKAHLQVLELAKNRSENPLNIGPTR